MPAIRLRRRTLADLSLDDLIRPEQAGLPSGERGRQRLMATTDRAEDGRD
jgi:hypothetical protein